MNDSLKKILLVDDNEDMLVTLTHLFTLYEYDVVLAKNGQEALEVAEKELPNLVILDALMPVMNGFEACKRLKNNSVTQHIPVIFLSANYTKEKHRIEGLELGADDYILKPFNAKELMARVKTIINQRKILEELKKNNKILLEEHSSVTFELNKLKEEKKELAQSLLIDKSTGLYNSNSFYTRLKEEFYRSKRYANNLSMALVEIDLFNQLLKSFGDKAGEYILIQIANIILNNTRLSDISFRLTEGKFGIILTDTDEYGAVNEAERIKQAVESTEFFDNAFFNLEKSAQKRNSENHNITVCIGVITLMDTIKEPNDLITKAEELLLKAKSIGKNITINYSQVEGI
jgi:diguanylate cyclase (GGDEF)-like protein